MKYTLKNGRKIEVKTLTTAQIDEVKSLQEEVIASLTSVNALQPLSREEFAHILNGKGLMIGAYFEDELIAFRAMLEPEIDNEHLGKDAGLAESEWTSVIYSEITNVKPSFRGNGLQVLLGKVILENTSVQRYRYICATVAPFNIPSLQDKFTQGLQIVALKEKYADMLRYILIKDCEKSQTDNECSQQRKVQMQDTKQQQHLFKEGWIGTSIEKVEEEWYVHFEK